MWAAREDPKGRVGRDGWVERIGRGRMMGWEGGGDGGEGGGGRGLTFSWFPMSLRAASMRAEKGCSAATPLATIVVGDALSRCAFRRE